MDGKYCIFLDSNDKKSTESITTEDNLNEKVNTNWQCWYMEYETLHEKTKGKSQVIALIDSGISSFQQKKVRKSFDLTDKKMNLMKMDMVR